MSRRKLQMRMLTTALALTAQGIGQLQASQTKDHPVDLTAALALATLQGIESSESGSSRRRGQARAEKMVLAYGAGVQGARGRGPH